MRLNIKNVVVKGKAKPVLTKEKQIKYDADGNQVFKYNIIGFIVEDLDGEIPETMLLREEAASKVFQLINKDILEEIKQKKADGEEVDPEEYSSRFIVEIENAILGTRTVKVGDEITQMMFLRGKPGVLRSLETPELAVNFLDDNGRLKEGFELFKDFVPKASKPAKKRPTKRTSPKDRPEKTEDEIEFERTANKEAFAKTASLLASKLDNALPSFVKPTSSTSDNN